MNAVDELEFRLYAQLLHADGEAPPTTPIAHQANVLRMNGGFNFAAYAYQRALNKPNPEAILLKSVELNQRAIALYPPCGFEASTNLYFYYAFLDDKAQLAQISHQIIAYAQQEKITKDTEWEPLLVVLAHLRLGEDYQAFMPWLSKCEQRKYDMVLPGTSAAINALQARDSVGLATAIDAMLVEHHKQANNRHSRIYLGPGTLISYAPYLLLQLAKDLGIDCLPLITQRNQTLKLGLSSPADFPELPKNSKFPLNVDYLTGTINLPK